MTSLIGIDLGGTKTVIVLTQPDGSIRRAERFSTDPSGDPKKDLQNLATRLGDVIGDEHIQAIGVAAPGPLHPEQGIVFNAPNLPGWQCVEIGAYLQTTFGAPVYLENDANAAALAEWHFGAGRGSNNMALLTMSTGVGGGLILNGSLYRGQRCSAGELGHLPVEWNGDLCGCGQRGCLEAYVGGASLRRRLQSLTPDASAVLALAGDRGAITPEHLVRAAHDGDAFALEEMQRFVEYLGRAIVHLVFAFAPERVVLGTIACAAGESLCFAPLRDLVRPRVWPHLWEQLSILPAALGRSLPEKSAAAVAKSAAEKFL